MDKLDGMPSIYYISIEESEQRRQNFHKQFEEYGVTNITPIIFKRFEEYNYTLTGKYVDQLHHNSKGPVTSHLNAVMWWVENTTEDYCFIGEDDISLETVKYWNFTWKDFYNSLPAKWDVIQMSWIRPDMIEPSFRKRIETDWGACAYLIKRDYAKKLIDTYINQDSYHLEVPNMEILPIIENIMFTGLGTVYNFPLFTEDVHNVTSTFTGSDPTIVNGQGECHLDSHNYILNWWKEKGSQLTIDQIMNINHIYQEEQFGENWFSYPNLYKNMVQQFPSGSKFVEVGAWKGKSSAFMAVEIANSKKDIEFTCIDTWEGSVEHQGQKDLHQLYDVFIENMNPVEDYYKPIRLPSLEAVHQFKDRSLDFVFIDASHEYEDVKQDICAWLPKVKYGGVLAGHDYYIGGENYFPGVKRAVDECLTGFETSENCWIYKVNKNPLIEFVNDTENAQKNFDLGLWYEQQNHLAPALSYFLRASERTEDNLLAYESLIHGFFCYDRQGYREVSAQSMLHQALLVDPKRPEAYYLLSKYFEKKEDWLHCYMFADLGVQIANEINSPLQTNVGYPGKYGLLFQKVVSGWWWGKAQECRDILKDLVENYWDNMPEEYRKSVENNYSRLGCTKDSQNYIRYHKSQHHKLRHQFKNLEAIENNFSQVFQDMFVLSMTDGKINGTFLEIGGAEPYHNNNTALLEGKYNWVGVSVELNNDYANKYKTERPNVTLLHTDATKLNYAKVLKENFDTNIIDYLQLDIEPAKNTFEVLLSIPFDEYKFGVITYEHDYYVDITKSYRDKSRRYLKAMGYELVVNDISTDGVSTFEDWWVHPDLVSKEILDKMKDVSDNIKKVDYYIYNK
jgi:predicted O-methyltransferase YrrM/tRNA G46 methylase TrmB